MNAKQMIAAVVVFAATGSVFAQEYVQPDAGFVSSKTRAEVVAELKQAQVQGLTAARDDSYPVTTTVVAAPRARNDVKVESSQASKSRSVDPTTSIYFGG